MQHESVLNTDRFDRRRFQSLFEMSANLKAMERKGGQYLPSFYSLMGDMWAGLYKLTPELLPQVDEKLKVNHHLMDRMMQDESFQEFRAYTKLDDLASAIGSIRFSEQMVKWIQEQMDHKTREQMQKAAELQKLVDQLMDQAQQHQQQAEEAKESGNSQNANSQQKKAHNAQEKAQQAQAEANAIMNQVMSTIQSQAGSLGAYMTQAIKDSKEDTEKVKSLLSGFQAGKNNADLESVPLRDKLILAETLRNTPKLKRVAQWAGRFKAIAQRKQRSKTKSAITRKGVVSGNNVEQLLPSELAFYQHPSTRLDFLRRFAENQTLQYDTRGKQKVGKGPIVMCLDQSGSMRQLDDQSKGFALALMMIARKQKRDFALINFSTSVEVFEFPKGKMNAQDLIHLATRFLNGGTNFAMPLEESIRIIGKSRFSKADVVFITDGEDTLSTQFLEWFTKEKKAKDFQVLSIVLGSENDETLRKFSDEVVRASSFNEEGVFDKAFSI
ncbi:uncharacterized protein with von Willebrand factor type A (vWA) domain [Brevibacillus aydinogluensis]|uniref:vWA domain-containing protein n=1 Tax=Brevibacillus aydinogluensis TaxID=927786 RepID=UPI0028933E32|nr:VWA domain-containing protein [Brevibacillus aydinogluensis]MDT3417209.1 uncharacterized protein with von Willebrand factor type A (vWA) domain [Brevibacillus aydinogluensis]